MFSPQDQRLAGLLEAHHWWIISSLGQSIRAMNNSLLLWMRVRFSIYEPPPMCSGLLLGTTKSFANLDLPLFHIPNAKHTPPQYLPHPFLSRLFYSYYLFLSNTHSRRSKSYGLPPTALSTSLPLLQMKTPVCSSLPITSHPAEFSVCIQPT